MADPVRDFAIDASGDLSIAGGDFSPVAGAAAVQQAVRIRVRTFLGEILLDQSLGVDYLNSVLVKNPDPLVIRQAILDQVSAIPDVTAVVGSQLVINPDRTASIKITYRTVYSETPVTDTVSAVVS